MLGGLPYEIIVVTELVMHCYPENLGGALSTIPNKLPNHALEAIVHDTISLMSLILSIKDHPKSALFQFGILPPLSMYVVESQRALKALYPDVAIDLLDEFAKLVQPIRHPFFG